MHVIKPIIWSMVAGLLIGLALPACRSARTIQTAINKKDTLAVVPISAPGIDSAAVIASIAAKLQQSHIDFDWFMAKVKVDYTDQSGKKQNATANIKMRRDSIIWVSLTGALSVEGFRVVITRDSVKLMDKLEKTYTIRSIAALQEITGLPFDFSALQDAIIGNPVYFSSNILSYKSDGTQLTALSTGTYFKHALTIDTVNNYILQSKLDDVEPVKNRTCFILYDGYGVESGRNFSLRRDITVTEKTSVNVKMDYKQVSFNEPQSFPFNIPRNYKLK